MVLWVAGYFRDATLRAEPPHGAATLEAWMAFHPQRLPGHPCVISTGQAQGRPGEQEGVSSAVRCA